jgi:hypothetical protein
MKKVIATILAILYLSTSMGVTVHLHYCMGKLVGWGVLDHGSKECTFCGMPKVQTGDDGCLIKMKGCCHDEHKHFKNEKDQKADQSALSGLNIIPALTALSYIGQVSLVHSLKVSEPVINGPPQLKGTALFLRNCNFRI